MPTLTRLGILLLIVLLAITSASPAEGGAKKKLIAQLQTEVRQLQQENGNIRNALDLTRIERENLRARLDETSSQLTIANARIEHLLAELSNQRQDSQSQIKTSKEEATEVRADYEECFDELTIWKNTDIGIVTKDLQNCRREMDQALKHCEKEKESATSIALLEGKMEILKSIEVAGRPFVEEGMFTDDYYYDLIVRYGGANKILIRVKTEDKESAFSTVLLDIGEIAIPLVGKL